MNRDNNIWDMQNGQFVFDNGIGRSGDSRRRGIKLRSDRLTRTHAI